MSRFKWTADSVGPGWENLVQPLIDLCTLYGIKILQIKEKFGTLQFYHAGDKRIEDIVRAAEHASEHTCEDCGENSVVTWENDKPLYKATTGNIGPGRFWIKTLCTPCREKRNESTTP